jgi:hypothetical protein
MDAAPSGLAITFREKPVITGRPTREVNEPAVSDDDLWRHVAAELL